MNGTLTTNDLDLVDVDKRYVNVPGDTMTGRLNLPADGLRVGVTELVVTNGGMVGIGRAVPGAVLDVNGTVLLEGGGSFRGGVFLTEPTGDLTMGPYVGGPMP